MSKYVVREKSKIHLNHEYKEDLKFDFERCTPTPLHTRPIQKYHPQHVPCVSVLDGMAPQTTPYLPLNTTQLLTYA